MEDKSSKPDNLGCVVVTKKASVMKNERNGWAFSSGSQIGGSAALANVIAFLRELVHVHPNHEHHRGLGQLNRDTSSLLQLTSFGAKNLPW